MKLNDYMDAKYRVEAVRTVRNAIYPILSQVNTLKPFLKGNQKYLFSSLYSDEFMYGYNISWYYGFDPENSYDFVFMAEKDYAKLIDKLKKDSCKLIGKVTIKQRLTDTEFNLLILEIKKNVELLLNSIYFIEDYFIEEYMYKVQLVDKRNLDFYKLKKSVEFALASIENLQVNPEKTVSDKYSNSFNTTAYYQECFLGENSNAETKVRKNLDIYKQLADISLTNCQLCNNDSTFSLNYGKNIRKFVNKSVNALLLATGEMCMDPDSCYNIQLNLQNTLKKYSYVLEQTYGTSLKDIKSVHKDIIEQIQEMYKQLKLNL